MKWNSRMSRWYYHRKRCRELVIRRAGGDVYENGSCEACHEPGSRWQPLAWCHLFGRGRTVLSEPLASLPCFTMLACTPCHDRLDDRDGRHDAEFRERLRREAIARARGCFKISAREIAGLDEVGAARLIERILRQTGELDRIKEEALTR